MIGYCSEQGLVPLADQCICPGYTLQLKCTIVGRGTTIWNVDSAMLRLRHDDDFSVDSQSRNGGAIEARGLSSDNNCYTSLLTILISPDLNGVNVTCQYDDGITNIVTIDVYSIQLTTGEGTELNMKFIIIITCTCDTIQQIWNPSILLVILISPTSALRV